ncbi:hypothetical protein CAPTEDRAFT_182640 [Capitella teleta]|uniref:Phospholysine phosphohistidine inorganic pyrophosphate phosphatase n=1 Tax=Capitella teleta TaxID=283909 RepID=R7UP30_CAPTE|nr:hypothetical protein CAPTEDRAFT_182640 [Capitella teleta]|eukprot:ELU05136.1 hypothetical protein CAPTEDRAFT_182640 [Capitella teleta]
MAAALGPKGDWFLQSKSIKGFLLDITGVLYENGGVAIEGSIEAVNALREAGIPVRFCTNETQCTKEHIVTKLNRVGFNLQPHEIFPPAPAVRSFILERGLRPHLLIHDGAKAEFADVDQSNPTCVVVGDAEDFFSYANMNAAFQSLMAMENPVLISMGMGKFYSSKGKLTLDLGPFTKALEFACGVEAEVIGKPSKQFFLSALNDIGLKPEEAVMIGDDIVSDVGGAQACGLMGVQVRTGKYRPKDENHATVTPDGYVDNLLQAVKLYLKHR